MFAKMLAEHLTTTFLKYSNLNKQLLYARFDESGTSWKRTIPVKPEQQLQLAG